MSFTPAQWSEIHSWIQGRRERLQGRLDKLPDPVAVAGPAETMVLSGSAKVKGKAKAKGKEKMGKGTGKKSTIYFTAHLPVSTQQLHTHLPCPKLW